MKLLGPVLGLALAGLASAAASTVQASASDCRDAIARYNSTIDDVSSAVQRYGRCVGDSRGKDDCSTEFRHLKSAQSDFEDDVQHIRSECD